MTVTENQNHLMEQNLSLHNCGRMMNENSELRMYQVAPFQTKLLSANHQTNNLRNRLVQEVGLDRDEKMNWTRRKWVRQLVETHI